jgi:uncharacterized membrane protein YjjP (DUF1212 family)
MTNAYRFLMTAGGYFLFAALFNRLQNGEYSVVDIAIQAMLFGALMTIWMGYRTNIKRG